MMNNILKKVANRYRVRNLPKTGWHTMDVNGLKFKLCMDHYLDRTIAKKGVFEEETLSWMNEIIKPGMTIFDVGANFGYMALQLAKMTSPNGSVIAFEPTDYFGKRLNEHIKSNDLEKIITVHKTALSDEKGELEISIGDSSATFHYSGFVERVASELIQLSTLDEFADNNELNKLDFVKVDIDGHEPSFLKGGEKTLRKLQPIMVLEFSQLNLYIANSSVFDQAKLLEDMGYVLFSEKTRKPYSSCKEFLIECGNYSHSGNAWAFPASKVNEEYKRVTDI